jgi:hypothetical protein
MMRGRSAHEASIIREMLRRTPLLSLPAPLDLPAREGVPAVKVFHAPEISENVRIRYASGDRMIDWEKGEWVGYEKEGQQWFRDDLADLDYEILYALLADQIRLLFADNQRKAASSAES